MPNGPVVALEATWTRPRGLVALQSATQPTWRPCTPPARIPTRPGHWRHQPLPGWPRLPALTVPRRRRRESTADFCRFRFHLARGDVALAVQTAGPPDPAAGVQGQGGD